MREDRSPTNRIGIRFFGDLNQRSFVPQRQEIGTIALCRKGYVINSKNEMCAIFLHNMGVFVAISKVAGVFGIVVWQQPELKRWNVKGELRILRNQAFDGS